jgi:hypothetical protein
MALTLNDAQETELLKTLGLPDAQPGETDVELVIAAVTDLADQAGDPAKPSTIAASAKRAGLEVLDNDTAAALRRDAQEGRRVVAAAAKARTEAVVDDAIRKGKIAGSRRKHWITIIEADPESATILASIADETAVPLTEVGHSEDAPANADGGGEWFY